MTTSSGGDTLIALRMYCVSSSAFSLNASCIAETGAAHMNHDYRLMRMTFCLSSRHDVFIQPLAKKYWATVDVGS